MVIVATASDAEIEGVAAQVEYLRTGDDLPLMLARLRDDHGVRSVLCEGGPTLNSHLLAAGQVDELFHCTSPQIVGGETERSMVEGRALLLKPAGAELVWLAELRRPVRTLGAHGSAHNRGKPPAYGVARLRGR